MKLSKFISYNGDIGKYDSYRWYNFPSDYIEAADDWSTTFSQAERDNLGYSMIPTLMFRTLMIWMVEHLLDK